MSMKNGAEVHLLLREHGRILRDLESRGLDGTPEHVEARAEYYKTLSSFKKKEQKS